MDCSSMMVVVGLSLIGAAIAITDSVAYSPPAAASSPEDRIQALAELTASSTPTIKVMGTVFCDQCHEDHLTKNSRLLSGATVALECKRPKAKHLPSIRIETSTDSRGVFQFELPSPDARSSIKRLRQCKVRLVRSPLKTCRRKKRSSRAFSAALSLKSKQGENLIYSVGDLSFQTKSLPELCTTSSGIKKSVDERTRSISWRPEASSAESDQFPSESIIPTPQLLPPTPGLPWAPPIPALPQGFPPLPISIPQIPFLPSAPGFPTSFPSLPPIPFLPGISDAPPLPAIPNLPLVPPNPLFSPPVPPPEVLTLAVSSPRTAPANHKAILVP